MITNKKKNIFSDTVNYIVLTVFSLIVLVPILWMVSTSIKDETEIITIPPIWIPKNITFASFGRLWGEYPFLTYFKNSIIIVCGTVLISVAFSCLAGYGVTRFKFKGRNAFMSFVLISQMFPSIMLLIPFYKILSTYGLNDTLFGLVLIYASFTIPFCSWMMAGFFKTIPKELDEAGLIDGCNQWQVFSKIILPLTLPGIAATAIYSFITGWNEYMFAQILINSPENKTVPVAIAELMGFYKILWNDMMAASLIASIPLIIMFIFMQKYFISSLTAGSVKG